MSANPEVYPWTPDDTKAFQLCDKTLAQMEDFYGRELDPSIFIGECPSGKLGANLLGFSWEYIGRLEWGVNPVKVISKPSAKFGLANLTASGYVLNPYTQTLLGFTSTNKNPLRGVRNSWNTARWATAKETIATNSYGFKPVVKLNKGACVGYLTIHAKKDLPSSFETKAAYNNWKSLDFSGTLAQWEAQKETFPNIYRIEIVFRAGQTIGGARTQSLFPFLVENIDGDSGAFAYNQGGNNFSYYVPEGIPDVGGTYMGGDITPRDAKHFNYRSISEIFNGIETTTNGMTETIYGTNPYFTNWCCCMGYGGFENAITGYVENGIYKPVLWTFFDGDPNDILDDFVFMGFAMTDQGQQKAANGDIVTDPDIYVPTYDTNGDIDGKSNSETDGQKYVEGGTNGEPIQPNFDPYAAEDEDEPIPEEDPSEEQKTDSIELPDVTLTSYGVFNKTYVMTKVNLQLLSDYLWNGDTPTWDTIIEDLKLVGDNRMNSIINVIMFPFELPNDEELHTIRIGRHTTQVSGYYLNNSQNIIFDLGRCYCQPKHGNFLDYDPYTKLWLYIPFIGVFSVPTQQFMNKWITVKLAIDVLTGSGMAVVFAGGIPVLYKNAKIGMQIPVTGSDSGYVIRNYLEAVKGGAEFLSGAASGNIGSTVSGLFNMTTSALASQGAPIQSEGSASPQCGMLMPNKCYFIIEYPKTKITDVPDYGHMIGYACRKSGQIGTFSGFSRFENVTLNISHCTQTERDEILMLLRNGVYL